MFLLPGGLPGFSHKGKKEFPGQVDRLMNIKTIEWKNNKIRIIDQAKLPARLEYIDIADKEKLWKAIKLLQVRGAPALGAAAALGVYLGIRDSKAADFARFEKELEKVASFIAASRPTARNLFWAIERVLDAARKNNNKPIAVIKKLILREAQRIMEEDRQACRSIGAYGCRLIKNNDTLLTICNAGILATIDYGTALGVIYKAKEEGKKIKVFACETRPLLQGARLTAWELMKKGVDVTLICDNTAASLMKEGKIKKVITGADRITSNGDAANKIGTYGLAILARMHNIPFYVAAPVSTFDFTIKSGKGIPIEQRKPEEVTTLFFKQTVAPKDIKTYNPAFDVTPNDLITAIITDKGIIRKPYLKNIQSTLSGLKVSRSQGLKAASSDP